MVEDKIKFKEGERVVFVLRPGLKTYIWKLLFSCFLTLIPAFFYFFLASHEFLGYLILICLIFLAAIYVGRLAVIYYYNVYIISNLRIIGIEQSGIFKRKILEIQNKHIKDVNFFKKKCLHIELLDGRNLILKDVYDNEYVCEALSEIVEAHKTKDKEVNFIRKKI